MNPRSPDSPVSAHVDRSSQTKGIAQPQESITRTGTAVRPAVATEQKTDTCRRARFVHFVKVLAELDSNGETGKLFPKKCRVCDQEFRRLSEYLCATTPKGHVFEDCKEVMGKPFTMMYRHCPCGNTLVLSLTEENFPPLDLMWSMLHDEAVASGLPLNDVVKEFSQQCDRYVLERKDPCSRRKKT